MANPFEDADVQAAAAGGQAAGGGNVYGGGGAYGDNNASAAPTLSQAQQDLAISVGTSVAKDATQKAVNNVNQDYENQKQFQGDHHSQPETPDFCVKLMMWLPIRYIAWFGGLMLVAAPIIDWILFTQSFVFAIIGFYLFCFGIMIVFTESPSFALTRKPQLAIYYWFRLLSRMWGRAWFYIFVSILTYTEINGNDNFTISFVVGIYMMIVAILMLIISKQAGTKYRRIFEFIAAGTDPENPDEMVGRLTRKFDELDMDNDKKIGSAEIVRLAEQAGRLLSNAERHAIQTFLDANCNGGVMRDDFVNQFMNHNVKQKWL